MTAVLTPPVPKAADAVSRTRGTRESLTFAVFDAEDRAAALGHWAAAEAEFVQGGSEARSVPLTCSSLWVRTWLEQYGSAVPHEFFVGLRGGRAVGIALLTRGVGRKLGPFGLRTRHLGTAGERPGESVCVEYNRLLCRPGDQSDFEDALLSHVLRDKSWEQFCLDGVTPEDSQRLLQDIPGAELRSRESPWYNLAATRQSGGDLLDPLGRSTRQNVRRLERKYGGLEVEWAEDRSAALSIFEELIELHQARWRAAGEPGAFHSPRFRAFQRALVEQSFGDTNGSQRRPIVLCRVRSQTGTVGCLLLLADGNRLLDYLSGFADFNVQPSPGVITHVQCLRQALARGFDAYDFLVGDKRHKANLSTDVNHLVWATWSRPSLKSRTIDTLRTVKQWWRGIRAPAPAVPVADDGA
jgi:hypothetical protein